MNSSEYTITMPYKEFEKWQKMEKEYNELKDGFKNCFNVNEESGTVDVQCKDLIKLFKEISPIRYGDYNYAVR